MSYHAQHNSQQKSLGIFIVITFHVLLISALINGLGVKFFKEIPPSIEITKITEKIIEPPVTALPEIKITSRPFALPTIPEIQIEPISEANPARIVPTGDIGGSGLATTKPKLTTPTTPSYPVTSKRLGEEGTTSLSLYITAEGKVADVKLFSSSGSTRLDEAAIKYAQRNWSFAPCTEGGTPVACWFQTKLVWKLEDAKH